ncbi:hypothetical protein HYR54_15270 [Candidatus Acetothermia bacterium]|nr:hypothetical protein [Candidatus Acetothermia bacterium]
MDRIEELFDVFKQWFNQDTIDVLKRLYDEEQAFRLRTSDQRGEVTELLKKIADERIQSAIRGDSVDNVFLDPDLKHFSQYPEFSIKELKVRNSRIDASRLNQEDATRWLWLLGALSAKEDGIILGFPYSIRDEKGNEVHFPSSYTEATLNLLTILLPQGFRESVLKSIAQFRGEQYIPPSKLPEFDSLDDAREELELVYDLLMARTEQEEFRQSKTPDIYYRDMIGFYIPFSQSVHVFSRTPGIVIPEEAAGSEQRTLYFEFLKSSKVSIYYQLDPATTAQALASSKSNLEERIRHFAQFLSVPNIEVSSTDFNKDKWKGLFTLTSLGCGAALSSRGGLKILRGVIANPWKKVEEHLYHMVHDHYKKEDHQIIKGLGHTLTYEQALEVARDYLEQWQTQQ